MFYTGHHSLISYKNELMLSASEAENLDLKTNTIFLRKSSKSKHFTFFLSSWAAFKWHFIPPGFLWDASYCLWQFGRVVIASWPFSRLLSCSIAPVLPFLLSQLCPQTSLSLCLLGCLWTTVWFVGLESWQTVDDHTRLLLYNRLPALGVPRV